MEDWANDSVAGVLEDLQLDLSERDLAHALREAAAMGMLTSQASPPAELPASEREFLSQHAGVTPRQPRLAAGYDAATSSAAVAEGVTRARVTADVANLLNVDPARVRHRLMENALYALTTRVNRSRTFPDWQFTSTGVIPHLRDVLTALPRDLHPVEVARFFTTPQDVLEIADEPVTPKEWLVQGGDPKPVAVLAASLAEPA